MAGLHKHATRRAALKPDALWDRCFRWRQRDKDVAEFYIRADTKGQLWLCSSTRLPAFASAAAASTYAPLFKTRQFTSSCFLLFYIRSYLQTFSPQFLFLFFLHKQAQSHHWTEGIPQEGVSGRLSHSFHCCQPKWNVMSCQENCEAISEPSSVRSVTFGVADSWCLPGALGPNWDLSASLVSCRGSFLFLPFSTSLSLSLLSLSFFCLLFLPFITPTSSLLPLS